MASIVMIPTGERLFIQRSEEVLGGLKLGLELKPGVEVSVHIERREAAKLAKAIAALCPARRVPARKGAR